MEEDNKLKPLSCKVKNNMETTLHMNESNPLLRNVAKWSDTLKKSCSKCCKIFKVCLTILQHCEVKG